MYLFVCARYVCLRVCAIETLTLTASVFLEEGLGRLVHGDVQRDVPVTVDSRQRRASLQEKTEPPEREKLSRLYATTPELERTAQPI